MKRILRLCILLLLFPIVVNAKSISIKAYIEDETERKVINQIDFVFRSDIESEYDGDGLITYTINNANDYTLVDNNCNYNISSFVFAKIYMGNTIDSYGVYNVIQTNEKFVDGNGNYVFNFTIKTNQNSHVKTSHVTSTTTTSATTSRSTSTGQAIDNPNGTTTSSSSGNVSTTNGSGGTTVEGSTNEIDPVAQEQEKARKEQEEKLKAEKRFDFYLMVWVILALVALIFVLFTIVKGIRANKLK